MTKEDVNSLKESIDTLIDENERLRKKIKALESEKEPDVTNIFDEKVEDVLEKLLLRKHKTDYDKYKPYYDDDWSYDPDRGGSDWSYRPKRGTTGPYYPWPYAPEVGDWPPGPQPGDVPPGTIPPGYPYWSIYHPYWPYYPSYRNVVKTSNTTNTDDLCPDPYTVSKTGEKIER